MVFRRRKNRRDCHRHLQEPVSQMQEQEETATTVPRREPDQEPPETQSCSLPTTSAMKKAACGQKKIANGSQVVILPKSRVKNAVKRGDKMLLLQCGGCGKSLLATNDTPMIYCAECGCLTPSNLGKQVGPEGF